MSKPARNATGREAPGQVINPCPTLCSCKDRAATMCPGEWEPGCDLGNNPKYVKVHKMTFEEYFTNLTKDDLIWREDLEFSGCKLLMQRTWKAAQENV